MLRALCLAMTLLVLPLKSARSDAPADRDANAALKYWQAFATLPRLTAAEQKKLIAEELSRPLDAQERKLLSRAQYALDMMQRGAALRRCDWGLGYEEGVETLLPHAKASRVLSALACLRARLRFEEGKSAAALDDAVAALTLSRHVSQNGLLISILVGYSIERRMSEVLALYLPRLNAKTIKGLKKRLDALPPGDRPATAVKLEEKTTLDWLLRKVKGAKDKEALLAFLSRQLAGSNDSPEERRAKGRAFLQQCGGSAKGMLKRIEEVRPSYARMAKKLDLPLDQFVKEWQREQKKQADNALFKLFFSALHKVRWAQAEAELRRALLSAALAVQIEGKGALKKHPDPVAGGSFEYAAFKGGFELRSRWKTDEKVRARWKLDKRFAQPVTLTAGKRGK
jgi:hypothetical protein